MHSKRSPTYRPFKGLKTLLEKHAFPLKEPGKAVGPGKAAKEWSEKITKDEKGLFLEAMEGVTPLVKDQIITSEAMRSLAPSPSRDPESDVIDQLRVLIRSGQGFVVCQTPEYMEGVGYGVNPQLTERLHRGDFSIQDYLDLHGYVLEEAKEAFEAFLKRAIEKGTRAVLIIHGRGLCSRDEPVIKAKVKEWLSSGTWRKWIVAFTSARACDGGAGATYVLLRQRPATKRHRKTKGAP